MKPFFVLAVQSTVHEIGDATGARSVRDLNLAGMIAAVERAFAEGLTPGLVAFPALALSGPGYAGGVRSASFPQLPGHEVAELANLARRRQVYVAFGTIEYDPDTPDRRWNSAGLVAPDGSLVLRYRQVCVGGERLPGLGAATEGPLAELFPVAPTALGRVGLLVGADVHHAEAARALALRGAELICHLDWPPAGCDTEARRRAGQDRAANSNLWWLSVTPRGTVAGQASWPTAALSQLVDHRGAPVASAGPGDAFLYAAVDLEAMRAFRARVEYTNHLPQLRTRIYAPIYRDARPLATGAAATDGPAYGVVALQTDTVYIEDFSQRDEVVGRNLDRAIELIGAAAGMGRILVFPEHWLQGYSAAYTHAQWLQVAFTIDGPEMSRLRAAAARHGVYVCAGIFERDPELPDRWFNSAVLIDDRGAVILRHRKLNCRNLDGALTDTTPGDMYTDYVARYGEHSLFPVVDTPLGRLACVVSFEDSFPEQTRMLALRGAEIVLQPLDETNTTTNQARSIGRRTRAYENGVYWIAANIGSATRKRLPRFMAAGRSEVIDYLGRVVATSPGPGESLVRGEVDLAALRRHRLVQPPTTATTPTAVWARLYGELEACPVDLWQEPMTDRQEGPPKFRAVIERLTADGVFVPPAVG